MLNVNPSKRLTPLQALEHAYFQTVRNLSNKKFGYFSFFSEHQR
jgi:hypothetical protein